MNTKALIEKRNALISESEEIVNSVADGSFTAEQTKRIDDIYAEVQNLSRIIKQSEDMSTLTVEDRKEMKSTDSYLDDCKTFVSILRDPKNTTSVATQGDNGAIIPKTIAQKIIDKIETLSDIYAGATKYTVKGTLAIPVVAVGDDDITVSFVAEGAAADAHVNKFSAVSLGGETYSAIVKVTKKFINNSDIAIVDFFVNRIATKVAAFIENVIFNGYIDTSTDPDTVKIKGIANSYDSTNMSVTGLSGVAFSDFVALKNKIPQKYRSGGKFYMSTGTKTALEQIEDEQGRPILVPDVREGYNDRLFGLPVAETDKVGEKKVVFAVSDGIAVKEPTEREIAVDESVYRANNEVGIFLFGEIDCAVENQQKVAVYTFQ